MRREGGRTREFDICPRAEEWEWPGPVGRTGTGAGGEEKWGQVSNERGEGDTMCGEPTRLRHSQRVKYNVHLQIA